MRANGIPQGIDAAIEFAARPSNTLEAEESGTNLLALEVGDGDFLHQEPQSTRSRRRDTFQPQYARTRRLGTNLCLLANDFHGAYEFYGAYVPKKVLRTEEGSF